MTAIYLIAALVALTWGIVFILRGSLTLGCLAFLVVGACFGHRFLSFDLGPIPLTLDRLVLVLLIAAYIVKRWLGHTARKPVTRTDLPLLIFVVLLILSGCYGGWGGVQGQPFATVFRLIAGYLIPFTLYWIARQTPLNRSKCSLIHGTLAGLGVYLAVTGLLEITGQWWAVFPRYIADPEVGTHFGRARGPMVQSVSFGLHLAVCLLAAWVWRWRFGRLGTLAIVALVPLMLAGIFFSYTRSVWMGTGLGVLIVLGVTLRGQWRPLVLGGMISAALLLVTTRMDNLISFEREYEATYTGQSVSLRGSFAYISWKMFQDRPLLGVGFGQFPTAKLDYLSDRSTALNLEATRGRVHHSGFLSTLTETGLIGLALFLTILIGWARTSWLLCRDATLPNWVRAQGVLLLGVLGIYVCQAAFHEMSYTPIDNALVFFLAGITVGLKTATEELGSAPSTFALPEKSTAPLLADLGNAVS